MAPLWTVFRFLNGCPGVMRPSCGAGRLICEGLFYGSAGQSYLLIIPCCNPLGFNRCGIGGQADDVCKSCFVCERHIAS